MDRCGADTRPRAVIELRKSRASSSSAISLMYLPIQHYPDWRHSPEVAEISGTYSHDEEIAAAVHYSRVNTYTSDLKWSILVA
jgi:hypothetical protein